MKRFFATMGIIILLGGMGMAKDANAAFEKATFAGGCFWCMESPFDKLPGVFSVTVGYTGGRTANPTYEEVSTGTTGHAEAIEILFDPKKIGYDKLLDAYWRSIDPTTKDSQFADHGTQYRTAIFYHSEEQRELAYASKERFQKTFQLKNPIVTEIVPAVTFYPAEAYHQHYYKTHSFQYQLYREGSGRADFLRKTYGDTH